VRRGVPVVSSRPSQKCRLATLDNRPSAGALGHPQADMEDCRIPSPPWPGRLPLQFRHLSQPSQLFWVADGVDPGDPAVLDHQTDRGGFSIDVEPGARHAV
jgi:hypothetical protein